jgi:DNA-binding LacI/PurR family transcriptional regulator
MTDPPLTTVEQFGYQIGQKSARLLLDRILSSREYPAITEQVEPQLIIRESTVKKKIYPF